jgi:hypothetical protein
MVLSRRVVACLAGLLLAACQPVRKPAEEFPPPPIVDAGTRAAYAALQERTVREGREADKLVVRRDEAALVTRFGPAMRKACPPEKLQKVFSGIFTLAPIGVRFEEGALVVSPSNRKYVACHRWGKRDLSITAGFDSKGAISAFWLHPHEPLPRDPRAGYQTRALLRLPFRGTWWVFWGGRSERENYHARFLDRRHAVNFAVWRGTGTYEGDGLRNEDYGAWNQPVLAPADGTVVVAVDGIRDNRPRFEATHHKAPAGNHVLIDLGNEEYALLAHLRKGSVRVKVGQAVKAGEVIGQCGNSGNSAEPHIHLHLQDRKEIFARAVALPAQFRKLEIDGRPMDRGTVRQGQFVRHLD